MKITIKTYDGKTIRYIRDTLYDCLVALDDIRFSEMEENNIKSIKINGE